jgi:hypothetical protein
MPVPPSRRQLSVVLAGFLTAGPGLVALPALAADSDRPAPPPGPYTSTTLVDIPVEEAEELGFPPLDYAPSLEQGSVPQSGPLKWEEEEYPGTLPAETGPEGQIAYPPVEAHPPPVEATEPLAAPATMPGITPEQPGGLDQSRTPAEGSMGPVPIPRQAAPSPREPAVASPPTPEPADRYPPLEDEAVAGPSAPSVEPHDADGERYAPLGGAEPSAERDDYRSLEAQRQSQMPRPAAPQETPQVAAPMRQPGPAYGYRGYQMPRPYYPGQTPAWGQPPGYRVPQTPQGQSAAGQVQQGSTISPSYPGRYYPPAGHGPGGYGQFYPPPPPQGSALGGQR